MCSLLTEPWAANFTGPKCRCGVPTPGNPEEKAIYDEHKKEAKNKVVAEQKEQFEQYKQTRIAQVLNRLPRL